MQQLKANCGPDEGQNPELREISQHVPFYAGAVPEMALPIRAPNFRFWAFFVRRITMFRFSKLKLLQNCLWTSKQGGKARFLHKKTGAVRRGARDHRFLLRAPAVHFSISEYERGTWSDWPQRRHRVPSLRANSQNQSKKQGNQRFFEKSRPLLWKMDEIWIRP